MLGFLTECQGIGVSSSTSGVTTHITAVTSASIASRSSVPGVSSVSSRSGGPASTSTITVVASGAEHLMIDNLIARGVYCIVISAILAGLITVFI